MLAKCALEDITEDVIRAFVEKIVAHKDGFDWYLRFSPDKPPKTLGVEGKRQNTAKVSSLCSPQLRQLSTIRNNFCHVLEGQAKDLASRGLQGLFFIKGTVMRVLSE